MNDYQFFERRKFAAPHLIILPRNEHFLIGHSYMGKWEFVTAATREVLPEVLTTVYFAICTNARLTLKRHMPPQIATEQAKQVWPPFPLTSTFEAHYDP